MDTLKKSPKELPKEQKMQIMGKLIPVADKLFEKWTIGLDRSTQQATWNLVAEACEKEGIYVGDGAALKNCVRNWINRTQKIWETLDSHEEETNLTDLQQLCIKLIHLAKGNGSILTEVEVCEENLPSNNHTIESEFEDYTDNSRKMKLEQYNLLLKNIEIERRLGLSQHEILFLRRSIDPSLCDLPNAASVEFESMDVEYLNEDVIHTGYTD